MQGFDFETIVLKQLPICLNRSEISETMYEDVLECSYKKLLELMLTVLVTAGK